MSLNDVSSRIDEVTARISKGWEPFYGPRGGLGVYDTNSGDQEYGHNAERLLRTQGHGGDDGAYVKLGDAAVKIANGTLDPATLPPRELQAIQGYVKGKMKIGELGPEFSKVIKEIQDILDSRTSNPLTKRLEKVFKRLENGS